jgi:hypothetical protein
MLAGTDAKHYRSSVSRKAMKVGCAGLSRRQTKLYIPQSLGVSGERFGKVTAMSSGA